jgi:hypothetical protein
MDKKKFVLRIDEELYQAIERWASDEFRSVNGQIEWMLHNALRDTGRLKKTASPKTKRDKTSE